MITTLENISIAGSKNKPILLDAFYNNTQQPKPVAIFVHGFKGFKDWGHFNAVAKAFAAQEFVFVKFNFSYNGTTPESPSEFGDLEAFGNNNYIIELDDLERVIDWVVTTHFLKENINPEQVYLIGHSRGGGISILKAGEDARIKKLVTWASVSDFLNRNKKKTIETWKEQGVVYTFNSRTKQNMPLYVQFYDTMEANRERLQIIKAAKRLPIPFLIIHGTKDEAVPHTDAETLHRSVKHSELLLIEGAGHTFEAKHPFENSDLPENAALVISTTIHFLKK